MRASTTCLIMADHNRYSVDARAAGRMVLVRSYAERIVVLFDDEMVADHPRQFRRDQIIYDPWHYLPVLMKKPGALRNGAPFKDWDLPPALTQVRIKLKQHADGDRQFVKVLERPASRNRKFGESNSYSNCIGGDVVSTHVRYRNKSGKHILVSSFSQADPKPPFAMTLANGRLENGSSINRHRAMALDWDPSRSYDK